MRFSGEIRGRLDFALAEAKKRFGAVRGLGRASEHLLTESNRTVPLEEGTLMRSGDTLVDERELAAATYYDTKYARRQHEEITWRHAPGRRAKWLERSLYEQQGAIRRIVAAELRAAL